MDRQAANADRSSAFNLAGQRLDRRAVGVGGRCSVPRHVPPQHGGAAPVPTYLPPVYG